jgi:hypothetical protein
MPQRERVAQSIRDLHLGGVIKGKLNNMDNPKEAIGKTKTQFHLVPPRVIKEVAEALTEGANKYGAYNFREAGVTYSTYYSSTWRHLEAWFEGEDIDPESGLSHVTKAIGGLIVLRDSMLEGNSRDDRPIHHNSL